MTPRKACCKVLVNPGKLIEINDSSIINDRSFINPNITLNNIALNVDLITNTSYTQIEIITVPTVTVLPTIKTSFYIVAAICAITINNFAKIITF